MGNKTITALNLIKWAVPYFAVIIGINGKGQPVLDATMLPPAGTFLTIQTFGGSGISPGSGGGNQTWDFSSFQSEGNIEYLSFFEAESAPHAAYFPSATSVTLRELSNGIITWNYYRISAEEMELLGSVTGYTTNNNTTRYEFTNEQMVYSFPASIGSNHSDNYRKYANESMGLGATAYYESGVSSYEVDGYGTLIMGSGTYQNCLRIKRHRILIDSTFNTMPFGPPSLSIKYTTGTHYEWLSFESGFAVPIWSIEMDTVSFPGFPPNYQLRVTHAEVGLPSSANAAQMNNSLVLYPNPAAEKIRVLVPEDAFVSVIDVCGRLVQMHECSASVEALPVIDASILPNGTYIIKAEGKHYAASGRIVVLH